MSDTIMPTLIYRYVINVGCKLISDSFYFIQMTNEKTKHKLVLKQSTQLKLNV